MRYGREVEKDVKFEDDIYVLVSCLVFVNYLIAKFEEKNEFKVMRGNNDDF